MITLTGEESTPEYKVAKNIYEQALNAIPTIAQCPESVASIKIASSVKLVGYRVSDVDIVIVGSFKNPWEFIPSFGLVSTDDTPIVDDRIKIKNFILAIEVKDHDSNAIQINGGKVKVRYSRRGVNEWKSATDQNIEQMHAIISLFQAESKEKVYAYRALVMTGLNESPVKGVLPGHFTFKELMTHMLATSRVMKSKDRNYYVSSSSGISAILRASIFSHITPTGLDRKRMDAILSGVSLLGKSAGVVGDKFVHIRGHGGTGKTILLLAIARKFIVERDFKVLILTFNHALAADITRLLSFLLSNHSFEGKIKVVTAVRFLGEWMKRIGLEIKGINDYDKICKECLTLFDGKTITQEDLLSIKAEDEHDLDYDLVLIDEAQDWPQQEIDLLQKLYSPAQMVIANGLEQMLRSHIQPNWHKNIARGDSEIIYLDVSLRMKRNLGIFANSFAESAEIDWSVEPSNRAGGGKVYFLRKGSPKLKSLHDELLDEAKKSGNSEIDILHCVPSSYIRTDAHKKKYSIAAKSLIGEGIKVWDAVDDATRHDMPRDSSMERIVHYNSCRGLEGWVVFLHSIDEYYSEKCRATVGSDPMPIMASIIMMIPLTRPIDSMVITYDDDRSPLIEKFKKIARDHKDFVEIVC